MPITGINMDLGGIIGGIGTAAKDIRQAITGEISPEKKAEIEIKMMELEQQAMAAQNAVNLEEAKSTNLFVSGWRPAVGWICATALGYNYIFRDLINLLLKGGKTLPLIDTGELIPILLGMLGLVASRTYEKSLGVQGRH